MMKSATFQNRIRRLFILCFSVMIVTNLIVLYQDVKKIATVKPIMAYQIIGHQFAGLDEFINGAQYLGYMTDQNMTNKQASKDFSHAQYLLAPTILDLNNIDHQYLLFVYKNEKAAWEKIKEIKAMPLRRNQHGLILAFRPQL